MNKKLSLTEQKIAALLQGWGYTLSEAQVAALAMAAKPERKAPAVKRDDSEEKEVIAEFCRASGIVAPPGLFEKPSTWMAMNWQAPVRRIINQCNGKSKVAIAEAVKMNRAQRLPIASPKSVEWGAIEWHSKQVAQVKPVAQPAQQELTYKL